MHSLREGEIAPVREGGLHKFLSHTHVLEAVEEFSVGHLDIQFLEHLLVLVVEVESHMVQPVKLVGCHHLFTNQLLCNFTLMDKIRDKLFVLLANVTSEVLKDTFSKHFQSHTNRIFDNFEKLALLLVEVFFDTV